MSSDESDSDRSDRRSGGGRHAAKGQRRAPSARRQPRARPPRGVSGGSEGETPPTAKRRWLLIGGGIILAGAVGWAAVSMLGDEDVNLDPSMATVAAECTADGARGTVTNGSSVDATVVVEVGFYDEDGAFLHKASATRPGIPPGESRDWQLEYRPDLAAADTGEYTECRASAPAMFRFSR